MLVDLSNGDDILKLSPRAFMDLKGVRLLIDLNLRFFGELDSLPNELRVREFPSLPSNFHKEKLTEIGLTDSLIQDVTVEHMVKLLFSLVPSLNIDSTDFKLT